MKRSIRKTVSSGHKEGDSRKVDSSRGGWRRGALKPQPERQEGSRDPRTQPSEARWRNGGEEKGVFILYKPESGDRRRVGKPVLKEQGSMLW